MIQVWDTVLSLSAQKYFQIKHKTFPTHLQPYISNHLLHNYTKHQASGLYNVEKHRCVCTTADDIPQVHFKATVA